jgi:CheY-like chemotaxis protein
MVKQLLTFARGEPSAPHKRVDVVALAGDVVKMVRDTFPKDIAAVLRTDGAPGLIRGDATQIHQLVTNLCVNARDAMPNGGLLALDIASVEVDDLYAGMSAETPSGHYVRLRVEDTGCGMTPEVRDRIFEPFFTTKPLGAGTGLGLSTCHAIARSHGGFILVASEVGRGARFDVYLPADAAGETVDEPSSARETPSGRGELVLVVDDEAAIRTITRRALERYGYRVLVAANGAEAIALFAANAGTIAVVLTDMSMPIMDGPKTIAALKSLDPSVRIIGSTGLHADGKVAEARALGVTDWVPKPYTAEVLLRMLRAVIG